MKQVLSKLFAVTSAFFIFSLAACNFNFDSEAPKGNSIVVNLGTKSRTAFTSDDAGWYTLSLYAASKVSFIAEPGELPIPVFSNAPYKTIESGPGTAIIDGIPEGQYVLYAEVWTDSSKCVSVATGYSINREYEGGADEPENVMIKNAATFTVSSIAQTNVTVVINNIKEKPPLPDKFNSSNLDKLQEYIDVALDSGAEEINLIFEGSVDIYDINDALPDKAEGAVCFFDLRNAVLNEDCQIGVAKNFNSDFEIIYPDSLTNGKDIVYYKGNIHLKKIQANGCTELDTSAFEGCTSLEEVNLPAVKNIPARAFYECKNLSEIPLENVVKIGEKAFYMEGSTGGSLKNINLSSCKTIGIQAFQYCCPTNALTITDSNSTYKWNGSINLTNSASAENLRLGNASEYSRSFE
ncbi:MAG: leucine-rich repeat domain-containing protein [Treponema sp.]|nr:leucine-rich repeat domain-containing protein [Treponema sp.]